MSGATIVWFRQDLRLADHPALHAAIERGGAVIPVYVWAPEDDGDWAPGAASRWWLHCSLESLDASLRQRGSRLLLRRGPALPALRELVRETGAQAVYWSRRYEPAAEARSGDVKAALRGDGVDARSFNAALLAEPWELLNKAGKPYQVFTPFKRRLLEDVRPLVPRSAPERIAAPQKWPKSATLDSLELLPRLPWYAGMAAHWQPGETGAHARLDAFRRGPIASYDIARNEPGVAGTSQLSPHLHFGELGPRQIWHALDKRERSRQFVAEVIWREFAHHLLHHFPRTPAEPLRPEYAAFPWRDDARLLETWQRGRTGIPMVDAGMRELWTTGWMHNRVRMIVASFLVKNLLQPWLAGAQWFWDTLVDADLASNTLGWQWTAGCGADAAPYFRVFNPAGQGERFDPAGTYVRRWIPEIAALPDAHVHAPWDAPEGVLRESGVKLGATYPRPLVDLRRTRDAALRAYDEMKTRAGAGGGD